MGDAPISLSLSSTVADAQFHVPDKVDDARFMLSALPDLNPASDVVEVVLLGSSGLGDVPISPSLLLTVANAQFHAHDKVDDARFLLSALPDLSPASDVVEAVLLGSDVTDEAKTEPACTTDTDSEEGLVRDLRLTLQEHSDNIDKKWGNSEQCGFLNFVTEGGLRFRFRFLCLGVKLMRY